MTTNKAVEATGYRRLTAGRSARDTITGDVTADKKHHPV